MIGIYKITNLKNSKIYIGQSIQIEKRWKKHIQKSKVLYQDVWYNDLYIDMNALGVENFSFEVIEECSAEDLNEREKYWIKYYNSCETGYNITSGGECTGKLSTDDVIGIIDLLQKKELSTEEIASMYNVHSNSIRNINKGISFFNSEISYPIRTFKDNLYIYFRKNNIVCKSKKQKRTDKRIKKKSYCVYCGKEVSANKRQCLKCYNLYVARKVKERPSKEELLKLIKSKSFVEVGRMYGVSDNAVRKWCKLYGLPYRTRDLKQ